ncbi:MAG TPA: PAS domain-containing sensor histidine kinase, partial [Dehalococcoidia bacterium]|nr:PAS domain-containing sensor histidine kinase [Dehalococcoidia bacterium]
DSVASIANSRLHKTIVTNYGPYSMKPEYDRLREYTNRIETLTQEISSQRDEIGTILSSLAEGILVLNQANEIVSTNPAAASLLDRPDADLIGKRLETYLGFSREDLLHILSKQAQDSTYIVKKRYQKKVYSLNVQSLPGEDERGGRIIVAIHDITEMDRVDQMKTEFVSMVSHELKTPLTSIKGYIDMILDGEAGMINSEQKNYLEVVRSSGEKLMLLVNDLLDISRIEAGKIELKTRPVILNHTINAVVTSMHTQLEAKKIQIKLDFESDPITVMADGMRLNQILTNLLDNACKYTREGSKVIVKARREGSFAHIDVIDSGIGISAEDQARIFTRFYRVDNSLTRKTGGTGLGLSVAKALVDMQGGRMWVQSEPDKGSTFSFSLPLQTVNQPV